MAKNDRLKQLHRQGERALMAGDLNGAARCANQMLELHRNDLDGLILLSRVCSKAGRFQEARDTWARVVKQVPKHAEHRVRLGNLELLLGRTEAAFAQVEEAYRLEPNSPSTVLALAYMLEVRGRQDKAQALLERHEGKLPRHAGITAMRLRLLIHAQDHDAAAALGTAFLDAGPVPKDQLVQVRDICFSIGEAHEKAGRYDEAFAFATRGNDMLRAPFDPAKHAVEIDAIIETFSAEFLRDAPRARGDTSVPVFIVGMPRSGSTLLEQIIHAHPQAHGAGELPELEIQTVYLAREIGSSRPYPQCVRDMDQEAADAQSRRYLEKLRRFAPDALRISDKLLSLYRQEGLIDLLFPQSHVIHVRRNPLDVGLACYTSRLAPQQVPFASDLAHIGHVLRQMRRLMDHWRSVLRVPILEVDYESLVSDQEGETRRIVEFLGLPWDDACLRFHEAKRAVVTLSTEQVRKPLYRTSIGRAEGYAKFLGPLREALGPLAES